MGAKKTAELRRLATITLTAAAVVAVGIIVAIWKLWMTSDQAVGGYEVVFLFCAGGLGAVLGATSLFARYVASSCDPADSHTFTSMIIQFLFWSILTRRGRSALGRLSNASRDLPKTQVDFLLGVLRRNGSTVFGLKHRFASIKTRSDYIAMVPLSSYANYAEYVGKIIMNDDGTRAEDAAFDGVKLSPAAVLPGGFDATSADEESFTTEPATGILTSDRVEFLACSAGTSGKNKLVPVTQLSKTLASHVVGPLAFHIAERTISDGRTPCLQRVLSLSYKTPAGRLSTSGLSIGPISTYIGRRIPHVVSPPEVYEKVTDEPTALHIHAVFGLAEREIGFVEALFSTLVYSFWRHVENYWPTICDQIETGRLIPFSETDSRFPPHHCRYTDAIFSSPSSARTSAILAAVSKHLRPDPERAAELRREFSSAAGFHGVASRIWPRLRAVRMTATGSFAHHAGRLSDVHMRGIRQLSLIHAASEGFYGVGLGPIALRASSGLSTAMKLDELLGPSSRYTILPTVGFYEFIPVEQIDAEQPMTLFAEQVNIGGIYELVYTSQTGLCRYRTGDVIKIVDFYNQCPIYEFLYRVGQTLNVYWEKTPESVFYEAIRKTIEQFDGVQLVDYTSTEDLFAPQLADKQAKLKHYILFIEIERSMKDVTLSAEQKNMFDSSLRDTFEMYAACRATGSIGAMRVHQVALGTFARLKEHAVLTSSLTSFPDCSNPQYKTPRVVREPASVQLLVASIVHS